MLLKVDCQKLALKLASTTQSEKELLDAAGISSATLRQIKSGKRSKPATVGRIAKVLHCNPSELVEY